MRALLRNDLRGPGLGILASLLAWPGLALADTPPKPDLLSFAHGAVPVLITTAPADLKVGIDQAIGLIDGNRRGYGILRKPATDSDVIEMTFALPAPTRFDGFAVPDVLETPSPSQTFVRDVEILGAVESVDGPYVALAQGRLSTHDAPGTETALSLADPQPAVRWVRLRLSGGIDVQVDKSFLEFSEIIGTGTQDEPPLSDGFQGVFSGRGVKLELEQSGSVVTGCYDGTSALDGTVQGNILRALGEDPAGIASQFILIATGDGQIMGLRSSNGAPFKPYNGAASDKAASCLDPEPVRLGCGSVIHGIGFDFDSDRIRPSSQTVLNDLFAGLQTEDGAGIQIVGHSSSEGAAAYNQDLSQRRAQAVVAALTALGLEGGRLSALGRGEEEPIASNADEAGRSLNRRVEIRCTG
ncbi:MAG: OmpA family protein [Pseudomonadota bacterium]